MYYMSFNDDFSKITWIYFLKKKLEVFERCLEFKALVENQTNREIKVLRIDNGGEFYGGVRIDRQNITPYMPQ